MRAGVIYIQEPFIGTRDIQHNGFSLHWPGGERKDARVLTAIRKDLANRVVVEKRSDLVDHPYVIMLDIKDFNTNTRLPTRCTRVVNIYDQVINRNRPYQGNSKRPRRAIEDIS